MPFSKNIIGKGFIAKSLFKIVHYIRQSGYIVYAAGISNSQIKSENQLRREINLFEIIAKMPVIDKLRVRLEIEDHDIVRRLSPAAKRDVESARYPCSPMPCMSSFSARSKYVLTNEVRTECLECCRPLSVKQIIAGCDYCWEEVA